LSHSSEKCAGRYSASRNKHLKKVLFFQELAIKKYVYQLEQLGRLLLQIKPPRPCLFADKARKVGVHYGLETSKIPFHLLSF